MSQHGQQIFNNKGVSFDTYQFMWEANPRADPGDDLHELAERVAAEGIAVPAPAEHLL